MKKINIIVFGLWLLLLAFVLYRNYSGAELGKTEALKGIIDRESYWYDIYAGSKKVGTANIIRQKVGDEVILTDTRTIKTLISGKENIVTESIKSISDLQYSIKSFEYISQVQNESRIRITGTVDPGEIIFFIETPETRKTFRTETSGKNFYLPTTFIPSLASQGPTLGSVFLVPVLDFKDLAIRETRVTLDEIIPIKMGINIQSLYRFSSGDSLWWTSEKGILTKETNSAGTTLYSQAEKITQDSTDRVLFDYTALPYFSSGNLPAKPEKLELLKVKIAGFRLAPELYIDTNVTLHGNILTIKKEKRDQIKDRTYRLPYSGGKLDSNLSPDEWVSSNYRPLQDTGIIYARVNKYDAFRFADYLAGYLFSLVRTRPMFTLQTGEEFLRTLSGDYLERTVMFASYARAAGLPTRLVSGLIHVNGYFYFHSWPEVWLEKWVAVDPTFLQFPADVTHIPLKTGTLRDITSIVDSLRSITIEIQEAS